MKRESRETLRAHLLHLISEVMENPSWPVQIQLIDADGLQADFRFKKPAGPEIKEDDDNPCDGEEDNAAMQTILDVLAKHGKPMKAVAIAREAGLSVESSYFKKSMANLKRSGRIFKPDSSVHAYQLSQKNQ